LNVSPRSLWTNASIRGIATDSGMVPPYAGAADLEVVGGVDPAAVGDEPDEHAVAKHANVTRAGRSRRTGNSLSRRSLTTYDGRVSLPEEVVSS
jgi:osmotically-inducible protein OsmY